MYHILLIHLTTDGHFHRLHALAIVNNAAVNMGVQISVWVLFSVLLDIYPEARWLDHMVILFLMFWGTTTILFSTAVVPFYVPTSNVQGFHFLHILTNTCYFLGVFSFFFFLIFLFLAAMGLCCCMWAFSSSAEQGLLFIVVHRLLIAVASLVAEHRL